MKETITNRKLIKPPDDFASISDAIRSARIENIIPFVVNTKKTKRHANPQEADYSSRENLIKITERLAADAKSGALEGLAVIGEYKDGYIIGLEGLYLLDPGSAMLPIKHLEHRLITKVEEQSQE
jgi:hypothetical protein